MILKAPNGRRAFKITDPKKGTVEDAVFPSGEHEIIRVGPPGGIGTDWLVLKSDPTIGAAENAIRKDSSVTVVDDPEVPKDPAQTQA